VGGEGDDSAGKPLRVGPQGLDLGGSEVIEVFGDIGHAANFAARAFCLIQKIRKSLEVFRSKPSAMLFIAETLAR